MLKFKLSRPLTRLVIALVLVPIAAYAATETFTYDAQGRLRSTTYTNGTSTSYFYDGAGNRLSSGPTAGAPQAAVFTVVSSTGLSTTFKNPNAFAVTPSAAGQIINGPQGGYTGVSSNNCNVSVAGGSTCTIVIYANVPPCRSGSYATQAFVTDASGTTYGANVPRPCSG